MIISDMLFHKNKNIRTRKIYAYCTRETCDN